MTWLFQASAYSMIHTCVFMCSVGGWYDPVLRGDSQPVRPQQADDPSDDQRSGQERPRGLHPGHVQNGRSAYNYQKWAAVPYLILYLMFSQ